MSLTQLVVACVDTSENWLIYLIWLLYAPSIRSSEVLRIRIFKMTNSGACPVDRGQGLPLQRLLLKRLMGGAVHGSSRGSF